MSDALTTERVRTALEQLTGPEPMLTALTPSIPDLCRSWLAQDAELAALKRKLNAALALADTGSVDHLARFGGVALAGWRVVEAMRETLIGG